MGLLDGLVGYWPLNRQSFDQATHQFADQSVEGNHGTGNGDNLSATFDFEVDQHNVGGGATPFDGSSDYIEIADDNSLDIVDELTICSWVKIGSDGGIVTKDEPDVARSYSHRISANHFNFIAMSPESVAGQRSSLSTFTYNTWYFLTSVYNGSAPSIDLYVDGVIDNDGLSGTIPSSIKVTDTPIIIGQYYNYASSKFTGDIADARIYNRVLSQDEITQLYLEKPSVYQTRHDVLNILKRPVEIAKKQTLILKQRIHRV